MRKKFDLHGEEGLKDDFHGGNRYESWKFYQEEFGNYKYFYQHVPYLTYDSKGGGGGLIC